MKTVSVLILNFNESSVSKDSLRRLLKEPGIEKVVLVDNGSTDGSKAYFPTVQDEKFSFIDIPMNMGPSVGRNCGIAQMTSDYIFLLDGDILYVPGTIATYLSVIEHYTDAFCVGQNSFEMVMKLGHNGTTNPIEADMRMPQEYIISDWFPMAWTQYGLFRGDLLRKYRFIDEGPFGEAGWGYEDDWFYHEMRQLGHVSLAIDKPIYYHEAHTGAKELMRTTSKAFFDLKMKERKKLFQKRWGSKTGWADSLVQQMPAKTTRLKP